ncbi:unnamed protein product, partial [marine sediment metagenome]
LLHDVLEDTDVTALELQQAFGKDIAHLVEGVTKISRVQESSPETRRAESIRKIILAMIDDLRVIFIKLADRIHNLKTLKFLPEDKQKKIALETLEIYAPIANRLGMGPESFVIKRSALLIKPASSRRFVFPVRLKGFFVIKEAMDSTNLDSPLEPVMRISAFFLSCNKMASSA